MSFAHIKKGMIGLVVSSIKVHLEVLLERLLNSGIHILIGIFLYNQYE